jgi:hypothetical protein
MMSVRWFNSSRVARRIAGVGALLGFAALVGRLIEEVETGHGLTPYRSVYGISVFPVSALIVLAVVIVVASAGQLLGWWARSSKHRRRRSSVRSTLQGSEKDRR